MKYIFIVITVICGLTVGMALLDTTDAELAFEAYASTELVTASSITQDAMRLSTRARYNVDKRLNILNNSTIDWDSPILTGEELARRATYVYENTKTVYFWGGFGYPFSEKSSMFNGFYKMYYASGTTKNSYAGQNYSALLDNGYYCWDCVGLIRGLFAGWKDTGVLEPENNSGMSYGLKEGTPSDTLRIRDKDADMLGGILTDLGTLPTDINERDKYADENFKIGEIIWGEGRAASEGVGHVGIYIGNGYIIESTGGSTNRVIKSQIGNRNSDVTSPNLYFWNKHGRIPGIKYD